MAEGTTRFDYDVIVVGFGMAGVCASIAAAESGARVLVVDRALGGGASALSGGVVYAGGGTSYQKAAGYDETPDNMFNYLRLEVNGVIDDETLKRFCDTSVDRLAWLERHGARFAGPLCDYKTSYPTDRHYLYFSGSEKAHPFCLHAKPAPRGHRQVAKGMSSGRVLWTSLRDSALRLGVTFMPRTRVDELVMVDGVVRGIRCRTWIDDGSPAIERHRRAADAGAKLTNWVPPLGHRLNRIADRLWQRSAEERTFSSPNVILSAGGFIFNRDMVRRYAPDHELVNPLGTEGDDGKGIELGVSAGGATDHLERVTAWRFLSPPAAMLEGITVGVNGERIGNEDIYNAALAEIMIRQFGGKGFLIVDSAIWKRAKAQLSTQTLAFQKAQTAAVFTTGHRVAPTLPKLAEKLGVSVTGLLKTVEAYNQAIATGAEDPAHKAADLCTPIKQGPFYGVDISVRRALTDFVPGLTLGGLKVDGDSGLVLSETGSTIPGLYAAGRTAVGICSNSYVSGLALADCAFSGKRAGEHAAATCGEASSVKPDSTGSARI
ncbi:FAD-binding protein [Mycolicibacterium pyrenivorans]|uniref:FAD-binding protein n=1 Tax=Mycolicibacterium pyrenivorans TaxID=187102 RepID=UPI0021F26649|nr:FAD-binding protein [Mycolicibacterium pyrenivorans]MCV7154774.1 FAD-binding protein [Mycolicibacterium pyrenivorans]